MNVVDSSSMVLSSAADIGAALRQCREKQQISLGRVSQELRLSLRQVMALESGQFSDFHSAVFVKGHLRACSKLYGMDGNQLVAAYERVMPSEDALTPVVSLHAERMVISTPNQARKYWLGAALVFLVALMLALYWRWAAQKVDHSLPSQASDVPANQAVAADDVVDAVLDNASVQSSITMDGAMATPTALAVPLALQSPVVEKAPTNAAEEDKVDAADSELHMEFSDDCWVQIKNSEGKILHAKNYRKGEVLDLTASPPLHIWLGRVEAANVSYNGAIVSVPVKPGYKTAQFVLGDDTQSNRVE